MKHQDKRFAVGMWVVMAGLLLAACQSGTLTQQPPVTQAATQAAGEPTKAEPAETVVPEGPNIVTVLTPAESTTTQEAVAKDLVTDPAQMEDADSKAIGGYVFEPLVGMDKGTPIPWLANSWTVAEDGLAYTFVLTNDTYFSDGTLLNSDIVAENFNRWSDPASAMRGSGEYQAWADVFGGFAGETLDDGKQKSAFDGVEKIDSLTVILHLNRPVPDLLERLAGINFSIAHQAADGSLAGTGAYAVYETNDSHVLLVPNPNYTGPYPASDNLEFPFK